MSDWQPDAYAAELQAGLALSGEGAEHFAAERARLVAAYCAQRGRRVRELVELGCGTGTNLPCLQRAFPGARVVGLDRSAAMVDAARARWSADGMVIEHDERYELLGAADLVFVNGVFHHVDPPARASVLRRIHALLRPGGLLALFDNNPLNLGAMWVMKRIAFDRDAKPVLARTLMRLAREVGFTQVSQRTHFYFPRPLARLRPLEPLLERIPLGAQYVIYASKR